MPPTAAGGHWVVPVAICWHRYGRLALKTHQDPPARKADLAVFKVMGPCIFSTYKIFSTQGKMTSYEQNISTSHFISILNHPQLVATIYLWKVDIIPDPSFFFQGNRPSCGRVLGRRRLFIYNTKQHFFIIYNTVLLWTPNPNPNPNLTPTLTMKLN